jgi:hypothetical protein
MAETSYYTISAQLQTSSSRYNSRPRPLKPATQGRFLNELLFPKLAHQYRYLARKPDRKVATLEVYIRQRSHDNHVISQTLPFGT